MLWMLKLTQTEGILVFFYTYWSWYAHHKKQFNAMSVTIDILNSWFENFQQFFCEHWHVKYMALKECTKNRCGLTDN